MDEEQLSDLKQFIAATVSQATANMATKEDVVDIKTDIAKLEKKVDDSFAKISEAIEGINEQTDENKRKVGLRPLTYEQQAA